MTGAGHTMRYLDNALQSLVSSWGDFGEEIIPLCTEIVQQCWQLLHSLLQSTFQIFSFLARISRAPRTVGI